MMKGSYLRLPLALFPTGKDDDEQTELFKALRAAGKGEVSAFACLAVLAAIASHEKPWDLGPFYPSAGRLGRMCGISERAARLAIEALESAGILAVTRRDGLAPLLDPFVLTTREPRKVPSVVKQRKPAATTAGLRRGPRQVSVKEPRKVSAADVLRTPTALQAPPPPPTPRLRRGSAPPARAAARPGGVGGTATSTVTEAGLSRRRAARGAARTVRSPGTSAALVVSGAVAAAGEDLAAGAAAALAAWRALEDPETVTVETLLGVFGARLDAVEEGPPAAVANGRLARWWREAQRAGITVDAEDLARFADVWDAYPKKMAPGKALAAWCACRELRAEPLSADAEMSNNDLILYAAEQVAEEYDEDPSRALCLHIWLERESWRDHEPGYNVRRWAMQSREDFARQGGSWGWTGGTGKRLWLTPNDLKPEEERAALRQAAEDHLPLGGELGHVLDLLEAAETTDDFHQAALAIGAAFDAENDRKDRRDSAGLSAVRHVAAVPAPAGAMPWDDEDLKTA
jgi:hypothetical protein